MAEAAERENRHRVETGPATDALIAEMVEILVREADPEQVILFGSRGRGDARSDSDVDLIVVEAEPFGPGRDRVKEMARLYRALGGFAVPTDILVYSTADVEYWRDSLNHVPARALRDGKVVYERPQVRRSDAVHPIRGDVSI